MPKGDYDEQEPFSAVKETTAGKDKPAFPVLERPSRATLTIEARNSAIKGAGDEFGVRGLNVSDAAAALADASLESSVLDSQPIQAPADQPAQKTKSTRQFSPPLKIANPAMRPTSKLTTLAAK